VASTPPAASPDLPAATLLFERDEEPSATMPLVYRERVFAVASGTTAGQAEQIARNTLATLRRALATRPRGRYVMVAVFDHTFVRQPEAPPILVLRWKDWRGEPEIQLRPPLPQRPISVSPPPAAEPINGVVHTVVSSAPTVTAADEASVVIDGPAEPETPAVVAQSTTPEPVPVPAPAPMAAPAEPEAPAPPAVASVPPAAPVAVAAEPPAPAPEVPAAVVEAPAVVVETAAPVAVVEAPAATVVEAPAAVVVEAPVAAVVEAPAAPVVEAPASVDVAPEAPAAAVEAPAPTTDAAASAEDTDGGSDEGSDDASSASDAATPGTAQNEGGKGKKKKKRGRNRTPSAEVPVVTAALIASVKAEQAEATIQVAPEPAEPAPAAVAPSPAAPEPAASAASPVAQAIPVRSGSFKRGKDLLSDLFDALMDLSFAPDAEGACSLVARLLHEHIAASVVTVAQYDIDKDEFVVVSSMGGDHLVGRRRKAKEGSLGNVVRRRQSVSLPACEAIDAVDAPYAGAPTVLAGAFHQGRAFALVSLARNPGAKVFESDETDAAIYVAGQLGETLSHHSVSAAVREYSTEGPAPRRR